MKIYPYSKLPTRYVQSPTISLSLSHQAKNSNKNSQPKKISKQELKIMDLKTSNFKLKAANTILQLRKIISHKYTHTHTGECL